MGRFFVCLCAIAIFAMVIGQSAPPKPEYFRAQDFPNDSGGKILLTWGASSADNLSDLKIDEVFNREFKEALPTLREQVATALANLSDPAAQSIFHRLLELARKNFRSLIAEKLKESYKKPKLTYIVRYTTDPKKKSFVKLAEIPSNANLQGTNKVLFGSHPDEPYGHFLVVDLAEKICRKEKENYEKGVVAVATREQMAIERFKQRKEKREKVLDQITATVAFQTSLLHFKTLLQKESAEGNKDAQNNLWLCEKLLKGMGLSASPLNVKIDGSGMGARILRAAWNKCLASILSGSYFADNWYPLTENLKLALLKIKQSIKMKRDLARSNYETLNKRWETLKTRMNVLKSLNTTALKHPSLKSALLSLKEELEKEKKALGDETTLKRRIQEEKESEKRAEEELSRFEDVVDGFLTRYREFVRNLSKDASKIFKQTIPSNADTIFRTTLEDWEKFLDRLAAYSAVCHLADKQIINRLEPWFKEADKKEEFTFDLPSTSQTAYTTTFGRLLKDVDELEKLDGLGPMVMFRRLLLGEVRICHGPFGRWAKEGGREVKGVRGSLRIMSEALGRAAEYEKDKTETFNKACKLISALWDAYCDALVSVKRKRKKVFEEALRRPILFSLVMKQGEGEAAKFYDVGEAECSSFPNLFHTGKITTLILAALACSLIYLFIRLARGGKELFIRKIPGLDAVDEAVGRATEMGRPVYFITGLGSMDALPVIAAVNILGRIARKTAEHDTRLRMPCYDPIVMSVAQEVVKEAATAVGRPDTFRKDDIFFVAQEQFAYAAAVDGMFVREKPATIFYMGMFYAESLLLAETGAAVGAIQIAGTDSYSQLPFFITACDYTLIGEELYAASAYLSREPVLLGSLRGQDTIKGLIMLAIFVGFILALFGIDLVRLLFVEG